MEEEVKYMDSCPQDFPLILLGNTQLGSELAGGPELAEQNLLATELFSFAWVPQKITGEERGHLFRETGASQSVKKFVVSPATPQSLPQLILLTHHKGNIKASGDSIPLIPRSLTFLIIN